MGDTYAEISLYYIIQIKGETNVEELSGEALIKSLEKDVKEYKSQNLLKALKRYYSIQKVKGKQSQPIEDFLNSETGAVSKSRGDLELIPHLIGKVSFAKIQNFLSVIKQNLGNTTVNEEWLNIDTWKAKTMKKHVKQLTDQLLAWTNAATKAFIKKQKLKI